MYIITNLVILGAGLALYAILPSYGKVIFKLTAWGLALTMYAGLFWVWFVLLEGMSWVQWFFGFAVIMSLLPAIALAAAQLSATKTKI